MPRPPRPAQAPPTGTPPRGALKTLLLAAGATLTLWFVPGASALLYPLRLFVTFIHEGSHALTTLATGGQVSRIVVAPDASGYTLTAGGWGPLIVMAGYTGAMAYGAGLLAVLRHPGTARAALGVSAVLVGSLCLLFVRPWDSPFGFGWGLTIAAGLGLAARRLPVRAAELAAMFLGVQCILNSLFDLRTLVGISASIPTTQTDAWLMSQIIPLPPTVWAVLWGLLALALLGAALRPYWRDAVSRPRP